VTLDKATCRDLFASARVARLATTGLHGPHIVPIVFAVAEDTIITAVDQKPKRHRDLARLSNISANVRVSTLADHYEEDWDALWWVRADGTARIVDSGSAALVAKYPHYRSAPAGGPYIEILVERRVGWAARP
jgi:PPOX class probable F420-dependent enzyme